jgi:hypothetical protein
MDQADLLESQEVLDIQLLLRSSNAKENQP